jgi:hypothetical protein
MKVETFALSAIVGTLVLYFIAAFLGGPKVGLFHLTMDQWDALFTAWKVLAVFLFGVTVGAVIKSDKS